MRFVVWHQDIPRLCDHTRLRAMLVFVPGPEAGRADGIAARVEAAGNRHGVALDLPSVAVIRDGERARRLTALPPVHSGFRCCWAASERAVIAMSPAHSTGSDTVLSPPSGGGDAAQYPGRSECRIRPFKLLISNILRTCKEPSEGLGGLCEHINALKVKMTLAQLPHEIL